MAVPEVDQKMVEELLKDELPRARDRKLVLVHGRYPAGAKSEFAVEEAGTSWSIRVEDQQSVLGIVDAWQTHRERGGNGVLVLTTAVDDASLGWDVLAHAIGRMTLTVDRAAIVARRFGAGDIDARVRQEGWLVDALLDAEPTGGWRRSGPVLTRDVAVRALLQARLGIGDGPTDAGTLLEWSQGAAGPARFADLAEAERAGLSRWLAESVGGVAVVLMNLVAQGRAGDAMALGVIAGVLDQAGTSAEAAVAVGGLLGVARVRPDERRAFVEAVEGTLERWVSTGESNGAAGEQARRRVLQVVDRADALAAEAGLTDDLDANPFLPSAFRSRLRALAAIFSADPDATSVAVAGGALEALREHHLARLLPERCAAAEMAVRLLRWLSTPPATIGSVAAGVAGHARDGGWVERAITAVWAGEPGTDPAVGRAYQLVFDAARLRRDQEDRTFADLLVAWTQHASAQHAAGALVIEQVLDDVVVPLLPVGAPLVVVLDGMSAAVAAELGEQLAERSWTEVSREAGRRIAAVATVPSVTQASRTSLLTGRAGTGDSRAEYAGFAAFWRRHRRDALLVHKAGIGGAAGHRLAEPLVEALADEKTVVGVVLNTIDDALDHGREGDRTSWRLADITYLPELLDAARSYARPVVLVADHGHVLERSTTAPTAADGVESARWRIGEPGPDEISLAGPRVLYGDGRVVVPWRADVRYTHRKAGYHGGASLAEMTVPVLVLLPSPDQVTMGWSVLTPESTEPEWWTGRRAVDVPAPRRAPKKPARKPSGHAPDAEGLFAAPEPAPAPELTLGGKVVASTVYEEQRKFVRRAPDRPAVAALIDALAAADGTLSAVAVAAAVGRAGRDPDAVIATLQRLLNVEGYGVLSADSGGRSVRLDVDLLRMQFGVESR
ncbi:BREX-2 system phosphatase PglZ [Pseudonocardia lacus]|uniref:BREX-2 system phosphatase PglZ n=1 Tax=Pseudonocardia lacus TaxID=2835865 RepID=UPI001BDD7DE2|nr:BREX-2 system phosphatase PglZ [Pseudonocardia lacus]